MSNNTAFDHSDGEETVNAIVMNRIKGALVATIQVDLTPRVLERFKQNLLARIQKEHIQHVILDFSGLDLMDIEEFDEVQDILVMASLMGVQSTMAGIRPGIAAVLVQQNADFSRFHTALDIEEAFGKHERMMQS